MLKRKPQSRTLLKLTVRDGTDRSPKRLKVPALSRCYFAPCAGYGGTLACRALRSRGLTSLLPPTGMMRRPDEDYLRLATTQSRALYSFNIRDFQEIHTAWTASGHNHCGIVLTQQQRYSTGEQIRRLLRLIGSLSAETMRNREEFLGRW
jgi:hypothetical protein